MIHRKGPIRPAQTKFIFLFLILFVPLSIFLFRSYQNQSKLPDRIGIVVVSSPYRVIIWDRPHESFTSVIIPDDAVIDVSHGYGRLPMRSLLSLDSMEKQNGRLLLDSMTDAVGFPIDFFIVSEKGDDEGGDERAMIRNIFSLPRLTPIMFGRMKTNIPWHTYVSLSRASSIVSNQSILQISVDLPGILAEERDLSGSVVRNFHIAAFDAHVGNRIEDPEIASERRTVAFFNASDIPGLAQKAVRLMEKSGVHVVSIGNRSEDREEACTIETKKVFMDTKTVHFIQRVLGCTLTEVFDDDGPSDIRVILYSSWGERYLPIRR